VNPRFPVAADKSIRARAKTGLVDAIHNGLLLVEEQPAAIISAADFAFMGGSAGRETSWAKDRPMPWYALWKNGCQVVLLTANGEARLREGLLSLMQYGQTKRCV